MVETVKEVKNEAGDLVSYLVDGSLSVPIAEGNRHYREVQEWIAEGNIPEAWKTNEELLLHAQELQKDKVRSDYEASTVEPFTDAYGNIWDAGYTSSMKLDAAKRLAELSGQQTVTFFDKANQPHTLTISAAEEIIIGLAIDYQTKLARKQNLFSDIEVAQTVEEVKSFVW